MSGEIFNGSPSPLLFFQLRRQRASLSAEAAAQGAEADLPSVHSWSAHPWCGWIRPQTVGKWKINALTLHQTNLNHILGEKTQTVERQVKKWGEVLYSQLAKNCKTETPTINASNLCDSPCWKDWKSEGNWLNTIVLTYPPKESTTRANQYFIIFLFFPAHLTEEKSSTQWAYFCFIDFTQDTGKFIDQPLIKGSYNVDHLSINIICPSSPVHLAYVPQIVWFEVVSLLKPLHTS